MLKQSKELDDAACERLFEAIMDLIWKSDVSWLTAITALERTLCGVMLNVECPHCRRLFVDGGHRETMKPLLREIRRSIEEDESTQH
jgi:hypothetical protein